MQQSEFTRSLKRLKISPKRKIVSLFVGAYSSIYKGRGIELNDIREYVAGDNIRDIDWNATAKTKKVYVREFKEARELNVLFVVDTSSSMSIALGGTDQKREAITDFLTLVTLAALQNNDQFGLILYNSNVQRVVRFGKGTIHAREIVNEVAKSLDKNYFQPTAHDKLKQILLTGIKKKTICFLISDAIDFSPDDIHLLKTINKRHELALVHIKTQQHVMHTSVPVLFEDAETGEEYTFIPKAGVDINKTATDQAEHIKQTMQKSGIHYCPIEVENPILPQVVTYFMSLEKQP